MSESRLPHLRLVEDQRLPERSAKEPQLSFSFASDPFVMVLVDITNVSEREFLDILERVAPDVVVELRTVPRFDFGRLNRKSVFRLFTEMKARYYDLIYTMGATQAHDARLNPVFLAGPLVEILKADPRPQRALVLLDDPHALDISLEVLPARLEIEPRWQVRRLAGM